MDNGGMVENIRVGHSLISVKRFDDGTFKDYFCSCGKFSMTLDMVSSMEDVKKHFQTHIDNPDEIEALDLEDQLITPETKLMPLQVYIAASMKDRAIAKELSNNLKLHAGVWSTAQWIDGEGVIDPLGNPNNCRYYANMDLDDIQKANVLIFLAGDKKSPGKTTELGYALATCKPIWFIGEPYSIFHHSKQISFFQTTDCLIQWLCLRHGGQTNAERVSSLLST